MNEHRPELDELLGAYALDATESVERAEIERYLGANDSARREVDELREAAALLALIHAERDPAPAHLWANIQAEITASGHAHEQRARNGVVSTLSEARAARMRRLVPLRAAAVVVALAAALSGVIVASIARRATTPTTLVSLSASFRRAAHDGRAITLTSPASHVAMAQIVMMHDGTGYLKNDGMHALPVGKVYQLWVIAPGHAAPISAGVLGRDVSYASFKFVGAASAVAVSVEDAPGATTPTPPVAVGAVA